MKVDTGTNTLAPYFLNIAPFIGVATVLLDDRLKDFAVTNILIQTIVFIATAQLPAALTNVMSWVDLAWPTGLVAIGLQTYFNADPDVNSYRKGLGACLYLFQGGRMALGATMMAFNGHMKRDMPRYRYQFLRWKQNYGVHQGSLMFTLMMQKEIFMQAIANMGCLVIPSVLLARNNLKDAPLQTIEKIGLVMWMISYCVEHKSESVIPYGFVDIFVLFVLTCFDMLADSFFLFFGVLCSCFFYSFSLQKLSFLQRMKKQGISGAAMTEGLWSISRHPNYLGEYMIWIALSLIALPSLYSLRSTSSDKEKFSATSSPSTVIRNVMLPLSLSFCSISMYYCLTWWTGAVPAEYFSLQKRKGYSEYMKKTPMLIPRLKDVFRILFRRG